jgi:predicted alpha/beta hydrolase
LLDHPLEGPVFLRSTRHGLPEAVAALDGRLRLDLAARLDAVRGRLRATFPAVPDVPLSQVIVSIGGGKSGLLVNTGGVCAKPGQADASFSAQDGKRLQRRARVMAECGRGQPRR